MLVIKVSKCRYNNLFRVSSGLERPKRNHPLPWSDVLLFLLAFLPLQISHVVGTVCSSLNFSFGRRRRFINSLSLLIFPFYSKTNCRLLAIIKYFAHEEKRKIRWFILLLSPRTPVIWISTWRTFEARREQMLFVLNLKRRIVPVHLTCSGIASLA